MEEGRRGGDNLCCRFEHLIQTSTCSYQSRPVKLSVLARRDRTRLEFKVPIVMRPDFYFNINVLSTTVGVYDVASPIVVICTRASAAGFVAGFPVQTVGIIFPPSFRVNIVERSGRFEETVCLYGRRDGEDGKQECHQTDRDGHDVNFVNSCDEEVSFDVYVRDQFCDL